MLEMGARFKNDLYVKCSFTVEDSTCVVIVEYVDNGEPATKTGTVTWDE